jgi:hypothetical protein
LLLAGLARIVHSRQLTSQLLVVILERGAELETTLPELEVAHPAIEEEVGTITVLFGVVEVVELIALSVGTPDSKMIFTLATDGRGTQCRLALLTHLAGRLFLVLVGQVGFEPPRITKSMVTMLDLVLLALARARVGTGAQLPLVIGLVTVAGTVLVVEVQVEQGGKEWS